MATSKSVIHSKNKEAQKILDDNAKFSGDLKKFKNETRTSKFFE